MRSLALKLTLAFLLVSLTVVALVAVFAGRSTATEFDRYVWEQARRKFIADVSAYYQINRSWRGVAEHLRRQRLALQPDPSDRTSLPPPFLLVDQNGHVVAPVEPYRIGDRVSDAELRQGIPVKIEGQVVGIVIPKGKPPARDPGEEQYLARTNQAVLIAALVATGMALVLGIFLARTFTRPLRELTTATRSMAKGELEQQVPVRTQDELGELAASFNQMSADLARANELRRQMTADIAHDLRTPLSVIKGYTEALRDGVLQPAPETFQIIHQEAEQLSRLVEDLRTLSLADAGELTLTRRLVHPRELLERTAAAHLPRAQQLGIGLQVTAEANAPAVGVDPERMAQVLGNLVSNALRHTPAGGQISLAAAQRGNNVLLTVQDNGVGIAPDKLRRIFTRFYRGDEARQAHEGESGLGLAIAKSLVELHGGAISVESTLGEGTTFTIALRVG